MIQERGFKSRSADTGNQTRFKHKSQCVGDLVRSNIVPASNGGLYNIETYQKIESNNSQFCPLVHKPNQQREQTEQGFSLLRMEKQNAQEWFQCLKLMVQKRHTSYDLVSGPWGVIQLWRLAPPGRNPSTFACKNTCLQNFALICQTINAFENSVEKSNFDIMYLIVTMDETHKFTHAIAMIIWRPEGMLSNKPPRWKNDKIKQCHSRFISRCCQHWA